MDVQIRLKVESENSERLFGRAEGLRRYHPVGLPVIVNFVADESTINTRSFDAMLTFLTQIGNGNGNDNGNDNGN